MINNLKIKKVGLVYSMLVMDNFGDESTIYARKRSDLREYYETFKKQITIL